MWNECNCAVIWKFFGIAFFGIGMETDLFQSCDYCWLFQICWHIECNTFTASSFRIWNSSTEIPLSLLALFVMMLPQVHLTCHSRCLALGEWSHHHGYLGHEDLFLDDPMDVGNLISGSSAFSESSFYIWKFTVHILWTCMETQKTPNSQGNLEKEKWSWRI